MRGRGGGGRGQINFDFAVGVSIVVVTIVLAFSFVPGVFGGVTEGRQQSDEVVADRVAVNLVEEALADHDDAGAVDAGCLQAFFDDGLDYCGHDGSTIVDNVDVADRFVNVSIERNGNLQCWDGSDIVDHGTGCSIDLFGGDNPASAEQVGTARRAVSVGGTPVDIVVRVW